MVGPNTMLAPSQWIKRNMLGVYSEELGRPLTDAEMRVQRCLEKLQVPDWYVKYSKPTTKFLKNDTPFECRPPTWKSMKGKVAVPALRSSPKKSRSPRKDQPPPPAKTQQTQNTKASSPRKSLNSHYRISRKADNNNKKGKDRLSISITPTSSDNETERMNNINNNAAAAEESTLSRTLRSPLNNSNTFPRMQPSRKIQNINIVFPKDFTPKPPRRASAEEEDKEEDDDKLENTTVTINDSVISSSTPRTLYTLTKNIELKEPELEDCNSIRSVESTQSSHTSFLFAEVEPCGVTTTMQVFAGMDSDESDEHEGHEEHEVPARCSPSPHTRFFNSQKKSSELERIVQKSAQQNRGNSLIREIIDELDRSIAESKVSQQQNDSFVGSNNSSQEFVKGMVRALESVSYVEDYEQSCYDTEDSDLAKSTSISFKSYDGEDDDEEAVSSSSGNENEHEDQTTPLPTYDDHLQEQEDDKSEEEEEEVYWIPSKIHELARTSSRLSVLSRGSSRSGFQCTSGRCSPGLSPIKSERARDEWTATLSSYRSSRKLSSRQLFRIDETVPAGVVADSGCYSDRSGAISSQARNSPYSDDSPVSSLSSSPTILAPDYDAITTDMLMKIAGPYAPLKSVRV